MPSGIAIWYIPFQIIFGASIANFLHAYQNHTVDILLTLLLLIGGVVRAQFESRVSSWLGTDQDQARLALLALLALVFCFRLIGDLLIYSPDHYTPAIISLMKLAFRDNRVLPLPGLKAFLMVILVWSNPTEKLIS
jgi:hypothetical protein